ncbi:hypothetical protein GCM10028803_28710 [Larkinella knui]|uniref:Lipoprotein n=1 Tax=Larkinella knui TaxID=2025310 RepID=A0A3P1CWW5_9BACT|nr:hypothetical protein [Larkinella knui]RRB17907.1 hypothetical protein EHT87_06430 [Larkinella knui]
MNTNGKLIQSALGLALGMWMLACGGSNFGGIQSKKPVGTKPDKAEPARRLKHTAGTKTRGSEGAIRLVFNGN